MTRNLHIYQSLWAMRPYDLADPPFADICARVAAAGYHGLALDFGADDVSVKRLSRPPERAVSPSGDIDTEAT